MAKSKVGKTVQSLGDYLRDQRTSAQLSLRQLADQTGVSNPYLSQIERGLRRPSAEVLQQIAKALRISAEQLYVHAGIINPEEGQVRSVELAILGDPALTERQKNTLLDVYQSFRAASEAANAAAPAASGSADAADGVVSEQDDSTPDDLVAPAAQAHHEGEANG
ncbi:MAG: helix-turn-helix domain-containing protein [Marmoricola sp.]